MKNLKIKYLFLSILILVIIFIFFPRTKHHVVIISSQKNYTSVYINNKKHVLNINTTYPPGTVVNYKYNLFKIINIYKLNPLKDRVMCKNKNYFELEKLGTRKLSKNCTCYYVDNNTIRLAKLKDIIVGINHVDIYATKYNKLKTFIIKKPAYYNMRVGISTNNFKSIYHDKISATCNNNSYLYSLKENYFASIPENSLIHIYPENKNISVDINGVKKLFSSRIYLKGNILLCNIKRGTPSFTPCYEDTLELTNISNKLLIINKINIENYLKKVVASEMPSFGGIEALKCQAIAARTYAISDMLSNKFSNLGFYVDDSTNSQVYNNILPNTLSNKAVDDTKGIILTYNNRPIDAKYYSTSAGVGTLYKDIWFNPNKKNDLKPYYNAGCYIKNYQLPLTEKQWLSFYKNKNLKSIDSASPYFRWRIVFKKDELEKCLKKSLAFIHNNNKEFISINKRTILKLNFSKLKNLQDITITKRSTFGNVLEICFKFDNATIKVKQDYNIRGSFRCNKRFCGKIIPIIRHKNSPLTNANYLPSSFFSIEKQKDKFILYGGGYGHGVGMSQFGALELSSQNLCYYDILNKFYVNVALQKIY